MIAEEIDFLKSQGIDYLNLIGQGAFGSIIRVYSTKYKAEFALKKIPKKMFKQTEVECLMAIDDPLIVRLYEYFMFKDNVYMLIELCCTDLEKIIMSRIRQMNRSSTQKMINDVIKCIKVCHDHGIAHCDIKPSNFLIDQYGRVKISDFGLSMPNISLHTSVYHFKGTINFMAPEMFDVNNFNPMVADIWALGVTMYYIATGTYLFQGRDAIEKGYYIEENVKDLLLRDLIGRCLESIPENRANLNEILSHPYFEKRFAEKSVTMIPKVPQSHASNIGYVRKNRSHSLFTVSSITRARLPSNKSTE